MSGQYSKKLIDAVKIAMSNIDGEEAPFCVSAQKREYHDGSSTWGVFIGDNFRDFATNIIDDFNPENTDASSLAAIIEDCWDEEWTDFRTESPVGDESHGSSDWSQRG